jgi:hypothetical protein
VSYEGRNPERTVRKLVAQEYPEASVLGDLRRDISVTVEQEEVGTKVTH